MHFDLTINLPFLATVIPIGIALIWKAGQFVEEMKSLRREFNSHTIQDDDRFERVDTRLNDLHSVIARK
jgi:hypothetical protein